MANDSACGGCVACCKVFHIEGRGVLSNDGNLCAHAVGGGCAIYRQRPAMCRKYRCDWLNDRERKIQARPDKLGVVTTVKICYCKVRKIELRLVTLWEYLPDTLGSSEVYEHIFRYLVRDTVHVVIARRKIGWQYQDQLYVPAGRVPLESRKVIMPWIIDPDYREVEVAC